MCRVCHGQSLANRHASAWQAARRRRLGSELEDRSLRRLPPRPCLCARARRIRRRALPPTAVRAPAFWRARRSVVVATLKRAIHRPERVRRRTRVDDRGILGTSIARIGARPPNPSTSSHRRLPPAPRAPRCRSATTTATGAQQTDRTMSHLKRPNAGCGANRDSRHVLRSRRTPRSSRCRLRARCPMALVPPKGWRRSRTFWLLTKHMPASIAAATRCARPRFSVHT